MTDREKVILGLELCANWDPSTDTCDECPYGGHGVYGCAQLARDALKLLKEQPATIKTKEEYLNEEMEGDIVWLETRDDTLWWLGPNPEGHWSGWALHHEDFSNGTDFLTFGVELLTYLSDDEYGKLWRIWTSKPTWEEMKGAAWDD